MSVPNPLVGLADVAPRHRRLSDHVSHAPPDREAVVDANARLTYAALDAAVQRAAAGLRERGVRAGDRVAMLTAPGSAYWVAFLATVRIGATWLGLNPRSTASELAESLDDAHPACVIVAPGTATEAIDDPWRACAVDHEDLLAGPPAGVPDVSDPDAPALIVYTSGSSGKRKGACLSQRALLAAGRRRVAAWAHGPFRTLLNVPVNHIGGVGDLSVTTLVSGGTLICVPRFDAADTLALIARERVSFWYQVPTMFDLVLANDDPARHDLTSLRAVVWSGGPASAALVARLDALFPGRLGTDYSQTESVGAVTMAPLGAPAASLVDGAGWPDPTREVRLSSEGEVLVRDDMLFSGYLDAPDATARALRDGWLHTGDIGEWRADGTLRLIGRTSEMFKSGGYNVYPREIEIALDAMPGVARAVVIARPDPLWGEIGHAVVEPDTGAVLDAVTLLDALRARLSPYKVPKRLTFLASLPLLPIGKVDRRAVAALLP
ncbi:MAG: AMP-binding protein [Gemmatimonadetes bacterium]|nr:AMP-binding protein [Gemmatimonadota bacterium]